MKETSFKYDNCEIKIISKDKVIVNQLGVSMPLLYSNEQSIHITPDIDYYYLNFSFIEYNNEILTLKVNNLKSSIISDDCTVNGNKLCCQVKKSAIEEIAEYNGYYVETMNLGLFFHDNSTYNFVFKTVSDIHIYYELEKQDVYVGITKLVEKNLDWRDYIVYETNVTSISDVDTATFTNWHFNCDYENNCHFKKIYGKPLMILCNGLKGTFHLEEIHNVIKLNNINIKYNFLIQPVNNKEKFTSEGMPYYGFFFAYPKILDFFVSDTLIIEYQVYVSSNYKIIRLNPDSNDDLKCDHINNYILRCIVTRNHFKNKRTGYYYTYYLNSYNKFILAYKISPIFVILPEEEIPEDNKIIMNIIPENKKIIHRGKLVFVTTYNDNERNIFNSLDIEEKTKFNSIIIDSSYNQIGTSCRLWKPYDGLIRIICDLNNYLNGYILMNETSLMYNNYKINIKQKDYLTTANVVQSYNPFIYSDKQIINIVNDKDLYELKFKLDSSNNGNLLYNNDIYNSRPLILYKEGVKLLLLNCEKESNIIKCDIKKDELLKILSYNGEKFYLSTINEYEGILILSYVLDIIINYENIEKQDIYLNITKLLTPDVQQNRYIVYKTNITDISPLITDYFKIRSGINDYKTCFFKKNNFSIYNNDKLLLLCEPKASSTFSLGTINTYLDDIHILYNFKINTRNSERATISIIEGPKISMVYPVELDFNYEDSFIIYYQVDNPQTLTGLKLNNDSEYELECTNNNRIKQCIVPKTHFNESGEYYTFYKDNNGERVILYEIEKIKIIVKRESEDSDSDIESDTSSDEESDTSSSDEGNEEESDKGYDKDTESDENKDKDDDNNLVAIICISIVGGFVFITLIAALILKCKRKDIEVDLSKIGNILPKSNQIELKEKECEE